MFVLGFGLPVVAASAILVRACPTIETTSGILTGTTTALGNEYLGIKYAEADRFAASKLIFTPNANVSAISLPPFCPQSGEQNIAEDCLYLNVYAPITTETNLPVMVWVHGGSFEEGGSADPTFNGTLLANEQNVVVVTLNYRLGSLGFYLAESSEPTPAVTDLVSALQWVHRNIISFGGDPSSVTLFGESSGATLIRALSTSSAFAQLYTKVILESDPQIAYEISLDQALNTSLSVLQANNCSSTACLKSKSVESLLDGDASLALNANVLPDHATFYNPWIDGEYVSGRFLDLSLRGDIPRRTFLIGTVRNETGPTLGQIYEGAVLSQLPPTVAEFFLSYALGNEPTLIEKIVSNPTLLPPAAGNNSASEQQEVVNINILATKLEFECSTALSASRLQNAGNDVYLFRFDRGVRYITNVQQPLCLRPADICHEDDLNAVFGNIDPLSPVGVFTRKAWGSFARTGAPGWPKLNTADEQLFKIGLNSFGAAGNNDPICAALYNYSIYS